MRPKPPAALPPRRCTRAAAACCAWLLVACAASPELERGSARREELGPEVTLGLGGGGAEEGDALLGSAGVLAPVGEGFVLGGRFAALEYESSESGALDFGGRSFDATQSTSGSGLGLGAELRYYPGRALDGLWLGGGALWFPIAEAESTGSARDPASGEVFVQELAAEEVDFVPYAALGFTFRAAGRSSWTLELDAGSAAGEAFAALTLRIGYGF